MADFTGIPGAVIDDAGIRHLGNPLGEQRTLSSGAAISTTVSSRSTPSPTATAGTHA